MACVRTAPARLVQHLPVGLDQPPRLGDSPLLPVERRQESAQLEPIDPRIAQCSGEQPLGVGELPAIDQHRGPARDRGGGEPGVGWHPDPGFVRRPRSGPGPSRTGPGGRQPRPSRAPRPAPRPGFARQARAGQPGPAPGSPPGPSDSARPSPAASPHRPPRRPRPAPAPTPNAAGRAFIRTSLAGPDPPSPSLIPLAGSPSSSAAGRIRRTR